MFKRPLVLEQGVISEFSDADILMGSTIIESCQNAGSQLIRLKPVYKNDNGSIQSCSDQTINTSKVYGLVFDVSIGAGTFGNVVTHGVIDFPENVWLSNLNIILVPGQQYYLHGDSIGTVPDMSSAAVAKIGVALTTTRFKLGFETPIIL